MKAYSNDVTAVLDRLKEGNETFLRSRNTIGDISSGIRMDTAANGQKPYAIVITCSDSRVIPEAMFNCGIGDLFVIRVAGNVIDNHQLGSIEYAADHLGTRLILVLGHTGCGAVEAAISHDPQGYIKFITDEISLAIDGEKDPYRASCLNVRHSIEMIESSLIIQHDEEQGLAVVGAMYHIDTGEVEFLTDDNEV